VRRNANRLLYLVSDLLLIAESDDGRLRLDVQDVDLEALAHESVEAARVAAERKRIELVLSATPTQLHGDPLRLAQLMDNLISNAIKFTPDGGRVTVTTAANDGHASLEVRDSGVGIAPADREQIFERFFRARTARKGAVTGAGLGLAITKAIVDAHGGSIRVESELGAGTSFLISLPLGDDPELRAAA
jgi:signal transduction histidine kinase